MRRANIDRAAHPGRRFALLCAGLSLVLYGTLPAADAPTGSQILKTFASEFVTMTPGDAGFPALPPTADSTPHSFRISKYEVWQDLYAEVMGTNPSRWRGSRNSAERMTWNEATEFCRKATERLRRENLLTNEEVVRLPTEAEWEYCCRAGTTTRYSFGDDAQLPGEKPPQAGRLDAYAWHTGNAAGNDPAVGVLKPNAWGLYDMHGYLWEFCRSPQENPDAPEDESCIIRGGSWKDSFPELTSASRRTESRTDRSDAVGFRCVIERIP